MQKRLMKIPASFDTERLHLRCYEPGDGDWFYAMSQRNREHLARFEAENIVMAVTSAENAEEIVRDLANQFAARNFFFFGVFEKQSQRFVAQLYVGPVNWDLPEFQIGYFVDKDHEGRGYVTEAVQGVIRLLFEEVGVHRISLECDDSNERSYRVAERCGMVKEAHFRQNKRRQEGLLTGTYHYALLRQDYEKRDPRDRFIGGVGLRA
jgi:RimJ/RimL family protein N-acetyltransferase